MSGRAFVLMLLVTAGLGEPVQIEYRDSAAVRKHQKQLEFARQWFDRLDPSVYRINVSPQTPDSGITTGLVIIYGHPIPPPYRVTVAGSAVFVNGIQVDPTPKTPGMLAAESVTAAAAGSADERALRDSVRSTLFAVRRVFDSVWSCQDRAAAEEAALVFLRRSPYVDSVWLGNKGLMAAYADRHSPVPLEFPHDESRRSREHSTADLNAKLLNGRSLGQFMADGLVSTLKQGRARSYTPPGTCSSRSMHATAQMKQILENPRISDREKFAQLALLEGEPAWYVFNYRPSEWQIVRP